MRVQFKLNGKIITEEADPNETFWIFCGKD